MSDHNSRQMNAVAAAFMLPWNAFVAAFLYYTLLTLVALGVAELPAAFIVVSYLLPVMAYVAVLLSRAVQALADMPVEIGPTPELLLH